MPKRVIWDEPKRLRNLEKHGYDFVDLPDDLDEVALVISERDERELALVRVFGRILAVVYAPRGTEAVSVISLWRPSRRERRKL